MNKIYRYTGLALLAGFTLLAPLSSCKKDSPTDGIEQMTLRLISSDHSFTATGGSGKLQLSEGGFTLQTKASWIHLGAVEGTSASFTVDPLSEPATRTGNILIEKGGRTIQLSITQLGAYDYLIDAKDSYEIDRNGGDITIPYLAQSGSTPTVEGLPDWIKSSSDSKALKLSVDALQASDRSAKVTVKLGSLMEKELTIRQVYGQLTYEQILGTYTITYVPNGEHPQVKATAEVTIVEKNKAKNLLTIKGLAADAEMSYIPSTSTLVFNHMQTKLPDGRLLMFTLSGNSYLLKDGKTRNYGLNWDESLRLQGTWDKQSPIHPSFTFASPKADAKGEIYHGVLFWLYNGANFLGKYRQGEAGAIYELSDIKLVKK